MPARTAPELPVRSSKHESLQPPGWPAPKGYANGIKAKGEFVFVGGMVGWDAKEKFPKGFVAQAMQTLENIVAVLSDAGYEVSTDYRDGMKSILAFHPDAVVLGANPPQLDCCDLLSQIKGSEHTQNIRVLMLSPGGSGERTRALDLGADDVLSLPFDPHELLSRVRSQLRSKHIADESRDRLRVAEVEQVAVYAQVDTEPEALGRFHPVTVPVLGDIGVTARQFARELSAASGVNTVDQRDDVAARCSIWQEEKARRATDDRGQGVASAALFAALSHHVPADAVKHFI